MWASISGSVKKRLFLDGTFTCLSCRNTVSKMDLILCMLGKIACLSSSAGLFKKYFNNTIRVSKSLNPDQAPRFLGPDLGPNCLL